MTKYRVAIGFIKEPCLYVETTDAERAQDDCMDKWDLMTSSEKTRFIMKAINNNGVRFGEPEDYESESVSYEQDDE